MVHFVSGQRLLFTQNQDAGRHPQITLCYGENVCCLYSSTFGDANKLCVTAVDARTCHDLGAVLFCQPGKRQRRTAKNTPRVVTKIRDGSAPQPHKNTAIELISSRPTNERGRTINAKTHHDTGGYTCLGGIVALLWRQNQTTSRNLDNAIALDVSEVPARYFLGLGEGSIVLRDQANVGDLRSGDVVGRAHVEVFEVLTRLFEAVLGSLSGNERGNNGCITAVPTFEATALSVCLSIYLSLAVVLRLCLVFCTRSTLT